MTTRHLFSGLLLFCGLFGCTTPAPDLLSGKIVDLSHAYDENTIFWPTAQEFKLEVVFKGKSDLGFYYEANNFSTAEHGGTHVDAPAHFHKDGTSLEAIPLDRLIGEAILIDVSDKCAADRDYRVQIADFTEWEAKHGMQVNGRIVLLRTGFSRFWPDRVKYMGTDERGAEAVPHLHFPGLHPDAAEWLVKNRSIKALGLDTPSIDYGQSTRFESHVILYAANIPAFENVANLDQLPEKDFLVFALPMKIKGGSGGPLRIIALVKA
ncbi:MAG: cyclase family protein [bacterium]